MEFQLNGTPVSVPEAAGEDRLLWVLRDRLDVLGPKFGCGIGACGACTVHVDGRAERSCLLAVRDVAGRRVVTLEGLGAGHADGLHPVQKAWLAERVPQCGYCQNGQIMTAAALLGEAPEAGPDLVAATMDGVLCRCGTQVRIRRAVARAQTLLREGA